MSEIKKVVRDEIVTLIIKKFVDNNVEPFDSFEILTSGALAICRNMMFNEEKDVREFWQECIDSYYENYGKEAE